MHYGSCGWNDCKNFVNRLSCTNGGLQKFFFCSQSFCAKASTPEVPVSWKYELKWCNCLLVAVANLSISSPLTQFAIARKMSGLS